MDRWNCPQAEKDAQPQPTRRTGNSQQAEGRRGGDSGGERAAAHYRSWASTLQVEDVDEVWLCNRCLGIKQVSARIAEGCTGHSALHRHAQERPPPGGVTCLEGSAQNSGRARGLHPGQFSHQPQGMCAPTPERLNTKAKQLRVRGGFDVWVVDRAVSKVGCFNAGAVVES